MAAEGIQVELSGVDVEQVFLDIFFVGFRSGAATTFKTICMNSLHWSEDRADRAAEDASAEIRQTASEDPLFRESALQAIQEVLRCRAGRCDHEREH